MIPLPIPEIITIGGNENRKFVVLRKVKEESHREELKHLIPGVTWLRKPNDPNAYIVEEIRDAKWSDITDNVSEQSDTPTDKNSNDSDTVTEK